MKCLNAYGLFIMIVIMIPNVIFLIKIRKIDNKYQNKIIELFEKIGRFGSMFLMIYQVPILNYDFYFSNLRSVYIIFIGGLTALYCIIWISYFTKITFKKSMALAILPAIIFLSSGIILSQGLLIITALLLGIVHIMISDKNNK